MRAEATIFPKIILLDEELSNKTRGNEIIINILYREGDLETAEKLKSLIEEQYAENLGNLPLKVNTTE